MARPSPSIRPRRSGWNDLARPLPRSGAEHNLAGDYAVPENLYSFTIKVLMPKG